MISITGTVENLTGTVSGYIRGGDINGEYNAIVTDFDIVEFCGYVEIGEEPAPALHSEALAPIPMDIVDENDGPWDNWEDREIEGYSDYNRRTIQFGDDRVILTVDATFPNDNDFEDLQRNIREALTNQGVAFTLGDEDFNQSLAGAEALDDPALFPALTVVVTALTAPGVVVHNATATDPNGNPVEVPGLIGMLTQ